MTVKAVIRKDRRGFVEFPWCYDIVATDDYNEIIDYGECSDFECVIACAGFKVKDYNWETR